MDTKINFDFVAPEGSIISSDVDMVLIPGKEGDAGILFNHAPYMTTLRQGIVEVTFDKDNIKKFLNDSEIDKLFNLDQHFMHINTIYERVFDSEKE